MVGFINPVGTELSSAVRERTGKPTQATKRTIPRRSNHFFEEFLLTLTQHHQQKTPI